MLDHKRAVSAEEIQVYLENKKSASKLTAIGVAICILAVVPLLSLITLKGQNLIDLSSQETTTYGLIALFALISFSVVLFVKTNLYDTDLEKEKRLTLSLSDSLRRDYQELKKAFQQTYYKRVTFAVIFIILSVVPLISVSIMTGDGWLSLWMVVLKLFMIAIGIMIIIPTVQHYDALKYIMNIGQALPEKTRQEKRTEKIAAVYWPLLTASYIGWSLWTMDWGRTWIVWPVAGILFAAIMGISNLFDHNEEI